MLAGAHLALVVVPETKRDGEVEKVDFALEDSKAPTTGARVAEG